MIKYDQREEDQDELEYWAAQAVGGLAVVGAVALLSVVLAAIGYWSGL